MHGLTRRLTALLLVFSCFSAPSRASVPDPSPLRDGDLVFQESRSSQSAAVRAATGSHRTHMGIVFREGRAVRVLEAVGPVKWTPWPAWVARGKGGRVEVKRVRGGLSADEARRVKAAGVQFLGRPYDLTFRWDDARMYCSELAFKAYERGLGRAIATPSRFRDLDLASPVVRRLIASRIDGPLPLDEQVVTPQDVYGSEALVAVSVP